MDSNTVASFLQSKSFFFFCIKHLALILINCMIHNHQTYHTLPLQWIYEVWGQAQEKLKNDMRVWSMSITTTQQSFHTTRITDWWSTGFSLCVDKERPQEWCPSPSPKAHAFCKYIMLLVFISWFIFVWFLLLLHRQSTSKHTRKPTCDTREQLTS